MRAEANKTEWQFWIGWRDLVEVMDPIGKGLHRTEWGWARGVMHCCAALSVLLVVQVKPGCIGRP
jgi:hypothetical protein